jgi:hypothetical protein
MQTDRRPRTGGRPPRAALERHTGYPLPTLPGWAEESSFLNLTIASLLAFTLTSSFAATISWTGGGDGTSWSDSHNWDSNAVPGTADDAVISGASGTVNVNSTVTIRSLQCERAFNIAGGSLTVAAGASQVQGVLTASGSTSVTVSGATTSFTCTNLANIDYISLYASGGGVLSLPAVRSYAKPLCGYSAYWQASGTGSRIVLAGLTNLSSSPFNCGGYYLNITAQSGGRVELAAVPSLGVGYFSVLADGSNSVVDLSGLTSENTTNSSVVVEARNQGQVLLPQLVDGTTVDLTMRSGGVIPVAQWQRLHSITLDGVATNFPALTNIDDMSLYASDGAVLSLPAVRSYNRAVCNHEYWQASGTGSRIVLAGLTNVSSYPFNCGAYTLYITAQSGGRVELGAVQSFGVGYFSVLADGSNSVVDLSGLTSENTTNSTVAVEARNQGQVLLPQLVDGSTVDLAIRSGGVIPVAQWQRLHSITLDGVATNFPALTNIDGMSLYALGGGVLSLPAAISYVRAVCAHEYWQASGTGSRIVLAELTNVSSYPFNCGAYYLYITAQSGGQVELGAVQAISDGYVAILADGAGSVVDLQSLSGFVMTGQGSLVAQNGGTILLSNGPFLLANVSINIPGNVIPPSPTLTLYGQAWHSYWVDKRDTSSPDSPWVFAARVPLTNAFQAFAPAPPPHTAFRVTEFVANPSILDLNRAGGGQVQLVLYGAPPKTFVLLSSVSLGDTANWQPGGSVTLTNPFRIFPPMLATNTTFFLRAKEQ